MKSPDITLENVEKIAELFPNVITEIEDEKGGLRKGIDFDLLKQELSSNYVEGREERYEFTWVGKKQSIVEANLPIQKTFRPCMEESKDWENTQNIFIEGDNLEALKLLQESYLNKVKMIYIDPPYNTGNDFIYNDNFVMDRDEYEEESELVDEKGNRMVKNGKDRGRYHSDWCSMLFPRLKLAHNLLREDGVIFVSIDDNEVQNLRKILDEIFGENNFNTNIIIRANSRGRTYKQISKTHENLISYAKNQDYLELYELEKDDESNDLNLEDNIGKYNIRELRNRNPKFGKHNRPNLYYPIYVNPNQCDKDGFYPISVEMDEEYSIEVYPFNSEGRESCWRWGNKKLIQNYQKNTLISNIVAKRKQSGSYGIYEKYRKTTYKPKSIWDDNIFLTETGTTEISNLNLSEMFPFPKPIGLIKQCAALSTIEDGIILDFFAGSCTTAHSIMKLNAEDGDNRRFIMIQLPELCPENSIQLKAGYASIAEIGKERIRRAGEQIKSEIERGNQQLTLDLHQNNVPDIGFRVYKVDDTNMKNVYYSANEYTQETIEGLIDNVKEDRTDVDLLYQVLIDWGLPLDLHHKTEVIDGFHLHIVDENSLIACFDSNIPESVMRKIAEKKPLRAVFRDGSFKSSPDKLNIEGIFKTIAPDTNVRVI